MNFHAYNQYIYLVDCNIVDTDWVACLLLNIYEESGCVLSLSLSSQLISMKRVWGASRLIKSARSIRNIIIVQFICQLLAVQEH